MGSARAFTGLGTADVASADRRCHEATRLAFVVGALVLLPAVRRRAQRVLRPAPYPYLAPRRLATGRGGHRARRPRLQDRQRDRVPRGRPAHRAVEHLTFDLAGQLVSVATDGDTPRATASPRRSSIISRPARSRRRTSGPGTCMRDNPERVTASAQGGFFNAGYNGVVERAWGSCSGAGSLPQQRREDRRLRLRVDQGGPVPNIEFGLRFMFM